MTAPCNAPWQPDPVSTAKHGYKSYLFERIETNVCWRERVEGSCLSVPPRPFGWLFSDLIENLRIIAQISIAAMVYPTSLGVG